jgi:hypothetical protein
VRDGKEMRYKSEPRADLLEANESATGERRERVFLGEMCFF